MKTSYFFDNSYLMVSYREVEDDFRSWRSTDVAPNAKTMEIFTRYGYGYVLFDPEKQKWSVIKDALVAKIKSNVKSEADEVASYADVMVKSLMPYMVAAMTGCTEIFPVTIGSGEDEVTFNDLDSLKNAYLSSLKESRMSSSAASVIIDGGTVGGVEVKPLEEQNLTELQNMLPEEAVLQVVDLMNEQS